jgi:hypothetical protein
MEPAWEQKLLWLKPTLFDPPRDRLPGLLRDLELYRTLGLLLHGCGPGCDSLAVRHVPYP